MKAQGITIFTTPYYTVLYYDRNVEFYWKSIMLALRGRDDLFIAIAFHFAYIIIVVLCGIGLN